MISVVTVVKDIDEMFRVTTNSISSQTCTDFEWIVKSADELPEEQKRSILGSTRNVRLLQGRDSGIYDAMNQALAQASGEYVFFLNSGDAFSSENLLAWVVAVLSDKSPNVLYGPFEIEGQMVFYPKQLTEFFFLRTAICHQAYFLRRDLLIEANGFDLAYEVLADHEIALRLREKLLASHLRTNFPITTLPAMGFSARRRAKKDIERKRLENHHFPWRRYWKLRLLLLLTLRPVRLSLGKFMGYMHIRSVLLRYVYLNR
jgi:glycosyltransferase involved in cell wall biosynthesis